MVKALFDTNILIDYLNAVPAARNEIARYSDAAISAVSWIEVMVGTTASNEVATRRFLGGFHLVSLDEVVSERAVLLRRKHRIKLPDAITWASAQIASRLFVTRDEKDFSKTEPSIRIPYTL